MNVLAAIGYNFGNVLNLSGRQSRSRFWPYAIFVFALVMAGTAAVIVPQLVGTLDRMQRFAAEHPEQATIRTGPGGYSISIHGRHPELLPDSGVTISGMSLVSAAAVVLLAAAVARRLHDSGKSALRGLLPVPFLVFAFVVMPGIFNAPQLNFGLFFVMFINNMLYLASLGLLVVWLAAPGSECGNRFGAKPGT